MSETPVPYDAAVPHACKDERNSWPVSVMEREGGDMWAGASPLCSLQPTVAPE